MYLSNSFTILRIAFDPAFWKMLIEVNRCLRDDPNYSWKYAIKSSLIAMRGEKIIKANGYYLVSSFLPPIASRSFMTMLTATPESKKRFSQQRQLIRSAPISCYIALTDRCNYACEHCSAAGRSNGVELSTAQWKQVVADLQDMGTSILGFTGGEPLIRDDIEEIVTAVDDRSVCYLFTNGQSLTLEKAQALKAAGLFGIGISLDAADAATHDRIRGKMGAFHDALTAMKNAREAGLHVMAQTVLAKRLLRPENESELLNMFKLVQAHGAGEVRLLEPICSGNLLVTGNPKDIFYSAKDREAIRRMQEKVNRKFGFPKITAFAHTESAEKYGCGAGNQHSYIGPDGQLYPCDFVPLSFGNVRDERISVLWRAMRDVIGIPKSECFAMTLQPLLKEREAGALPVPKGESEKICGANQSDEFPGFFSSLQDKTEEDI